ncbi:MAG TPA: lytic murein transglycosylase [Leucothrix mucor]|nr:lytic murein transglycosylase [Leucothrix mucor]
MKMLLEKKQKTIILDSIKVRANNFVGMLVVLLFCCLPQQAISDSEVVDITFTEWQENFKQLAVEKGIPEDILDSAFQDMTLNTKVLKLDNSQPEFTRAIWAYLDNAISDQRIKKGKEVLNQHRHLFEEISSKYGVPAEIIIAIWAMESDFGGNYGSMSVIRSLATLAYAGKRKEFAQTELLAVFRIMVCESLQVEDMVGSWAGAIGQPQFMPTSFQKYAVDYNKDNKRDIWRSLDDAFASIANYMHASGWNIGEPWGLEAILPSDFDWQKQAADNPENKPMTISAWKQLGISFASDESFANDDQLASLFFPAGHLGPIFLTFSNFEVIKKYNLSLSYSLAVGLLSSGIAKDTKLFGVWPRDDKPLSYDDKILLQAQLNAAGFNVGEVDGKVGSNTRKAIRGWQLKNNLAADGYITLPLLGRFKQAFKE